MCSTRSNFAVLGTMRHPSLISASLRFRLRFSSMSLSLESNVKTSDLRSADSGLFVSTSWDIVKRPGVRGNGANSSLKTPCAILLPKMLYQRLASHGTVKVAVQEATEFVGTPPQK